MKETNYLTKSPTFSPTQIEAISMKLAKVKKKNDFFCLEIRYSPELSEGNF